MQFLSVTIIQVKANYWAVISCCTDYDVHTIVDSNFPSVDTTFKYEIKAVLFITLYKLKDWVLTLNLCDHSLQTESY